MRTLLILIAVALLSMGGVYLALTWRGKTLGEKPPTLFRSPADEGRLLQSAIGEKGVALFYVDPATSLLRPEWRRVPVSDDLEREAVLILEELLDGPTEGGLSALPPGTRVRHVFVDNQGVAYADFNAPIRTAHPGGGWAEMLTVYSVVDTLLQNIPSLRAVQFLIDGEEVETLAGHFDLRYPLVFRGDLLGSPPPDGTGEGLP